MGGPTTLWVNHVKQQYHVVIVMRSAFQIASWTVAKELEWQALFFCFCFGAPSPLLRASESGSFLIANSRRLVKF